MKFKENSQSSRYRLKFSTTQCRKKSNRLTLFFYDKIILFPIRHNENTNAIAKKN